MCHHLRRLFPFFKRNILHPSFNVESEIKIWLSLELSGGFFGRLFTIQCDGLENLEKLGREEPLEGIWIGDPDDAFQASAEGNNARGCGAKSLCLLENISDGVVTPVTCINESFYYHFSINDFCALEESRYSAGSSGCI